MICNCNIIVQLVKGQVKWQNTCCVDMKRWLHSLCQPHEGLPICSKELSMSWFRKSWCWRLCHQGKHAVDKLHDSIKGSNTHQVHRQCTASHSLQQAEVTSNFCFLFLLFVLYNQAATSLIQLDLLIWPLTCQLLLTSHALARSYIFEFTCLKHG